MKNITYPVQNVQVGGGSGAHVKLQIGGGGGMTTGGTQKIPIGRLTCNTPVKT